MQNDMRDRLVKKIAFKLYICNESDCADCEYRDIEYDKCKAMFLADSILEDGWIRPPCKVGDTVWVDDFMWGLIPCKVDRPYHCTCGENGGCTFEMSFTDDDIGKTVFLKVERVPTKEQAEQKLKELSENAET